MTKEQEILVLQELQRHEQALTDIAAQTNGKSPAELKEIKADEFINSMQSMNNTGKKAPEAKDDEGEFIEMMKQINMKGVKLQ